MFTKQVSSEHYRLARYSSPSRWASYYWQLRLVTDVLPQTVLEVGLGDGVFGRYLKEVMKIGYVGVDIDEELRPDIVGEITALPVETKSFDAVCVFEVLEHLPFEVVPRALSELHRVSKKYVIISVPDRYPFIKIAFKVPLFPNVQILFKVPFLRPGSRGKQHFWEIGWKDFPLRKITKSFEGYFEIEKHFVPFENPHHHFFLLRKREL